MNRWMPFVAALGVAAGAAVGVSLLIFMAFPDDWGLPPPESALDAFELDMRQGLVRDEAAVDAAYLRACDDGYEPACPALDYKADLALVGELFADLCSSRDPAACIVVGWAETQWDVNGDRSRATDGLLWSGADAHDRDLWDEREAQGAERFLTACDAGNERGCAELGRLHGWGVGVDQDHALAFELFVQACDAGEPVGCNWAGDVQEDVLGGDSEHWYRRACDMGLADGCRNLSNVAEMGHPERAAMLGRACDDGDARACSWHADWLMDGEEYELGRARYESACDSGIGAACDDLAGYLLNGVGMDEDRERAFELNVEACRLGDAAGCAHAAYRRMDAEDEDGTLLYLQKACTGLHAEACTDLGDVLVETEAGGRALRAFERACDLGDGEACNRYGVVIVDGLGGVEQDWWQGEAWFRRSCDLEWGWGCKNVADRLEESAEKARMLSKACQLGVAEACPTYEPPELPEAEDTGLLRAEVSEILKMIGNAGEPMDGLEGGVEGGLGFPVED
ncbi:MAG: sel1 repeat family protein [Proteobacteria bacterium]|nr:sel1 repeat family protein [Pseudomonadota bacterium]MCP4915649.1 sel1 repeat family protein [Pseudomonadota bacterium]